MTTVLPIYGGPLKRELVVQARAEGGMRNSSNPVTPEEFSEDIQRLNALMAQWAGLEGIDLGYNFPTSSVGSPNDESGIPGFATQAVTVALAFRIFPTIGKTTSGETRATLARSMDLLRASCMTVPQSRMRGTTPRGAGNRRWRWSAYYTESPATPADES